MSSEYAVVFVSVFVGLFVLRLIVATIVFVWILPEDTACPVCDSPTLHVQRPVLNRLVPVLRASWCVECGWEGTLRRPRGGVQTPPSRESAHRRPAAARR